MNDKIGKNIRFFRTVKGISQKELADKIEKDRSSITYWETGKTTMSLDSVIKIAEALDISILDLLKTDVENGETKENKDDLLWFSNLLVNEKVLRDGYKLTSKEYNKIISFLKINIDFLINMNDDK